LSDKVKNNPLVQLLQPAQLSEIKSAFKKMDYDGSGAIEPSELQNTMAAMGYVGDTTEMMQSVDTDNSGKIEYDEFALIMAKRILETDGQVELDMAFKLFDKDGNGYITKEEAIKMLTTTGQPFTTAEMDMFLSMVDVSADGRIGEDEFRKMDCWKIPEIPGHSSSSGADARTGG